MRAHAYRIVSHLNTQKIHHLDRNWIHYFISREFFLERSIQQRSSFAPWFLVWSWSWPIKEKDINPVNILELKWQRGFFAEFVYYTKCLLNIWKDSVKLLFNNSTLMSWNVRLCLKHTSQVYQYANLVRYALLRLWWEWKEMLLCVSSRKHIKHVKFNYLPIPILHKTLCKRFS